MTAGIDRAVSRRQILSQIECHTLDSRRAVSHRSAAMNGQVR